MSDPGTTARTYQRTHPWITFSLNLERANPSLWLLLGEAKSKCEHMQGIALLPEFAKQLHTLSLAKGVLATTAIEGNTLTEEQVVQHLAGKLELPPSKEYLRNEIENVIRACNEIGAEVMKLGPTPITVDKLIKYNKMLLDGLELGEGVVPGEIPTHSVGVGAYRGAPREDCTYLLGRLCSWLDSDDFKPKTPDLAIVCGVIKAIVAHLYIAWIHPFGDGNGRLSRLIELEILLSAGLPTHAAHLLSNHYNETRPVYYRQLDAASKSGGDVLPFISYAVQGFVEGLRAQMERIKSQQIAVHWINYVHQQFRGGSSRTKTRRRDLVLALSRSEPAPIAEIRGLTPGLAEAYAGKTDKTIRRDLNALEKMNLIQRTGDSFQARVELMAAFLPHSVRNAPQPSK